MSKYVSKHAVIILCIFAAPVAAFASAATAEAGEVSMTHRMMMLVIQLGLILFVAKLGNLLFERIRMPGALGELIAGIVIGPFALGRLGFYGFPDGLFAAAESGAVISPELAGMAAVAAVVLLFHAGLETDLKLLLRYSVVGGIVGMGGMFASFFGGAATVMVFSKVLFGEQLGLFAPPCLMLGVITTATSVGISARILSEKRKMDSPEGVTIISAAVIDDVLGIILLAVIMSILSAAGDGGVDWGRVGIVAGKAVGVWLGATVLGLAASSRISLLLKWFGERTSIAVMALGLALILAGLFEEAGLAMIIGAYVMGLSLSTADIRHVIAEKLSPIYIFLVPVFFCTAGMQINLTVLSSPKVLGFGLIYALVALGAKVFGCGLPALAANFNLRGAARIGFGMAPRCEVALIIAGVGMAAGLLGPEIFAAVVIMVVVNTVIAPPVMMALYRNDATGVRKAVGGEKAETSLSFNFPTLEMAEFFIGKLAPIFEAEGFFVHQLSREHRLYQLRKGSSVIDLHLSGTALNFSCRQTDAALVNAGVHEALAAVERSVRALKEPLDSAAMRSRLQDVGPLGPAELNLGDYLDVRMIKRRLRGSTKAEIIDELLDLLDRSGQLTDVAAAREAVWEREDSMSTGLQYGVAIPHGKTDAVDRLVCAVGLRPRGVDFKSMDGKPSQIFVLTLSPKSKPAPHLQFMSTVSRILNKNGRRRVLAARTAEVVLEEFTAPPPVTATPAPAPAPKPEPMPRQLSLADYIRPACVTTQLTATTKAGVIAELIGLLADAGCLIDADAVADAVLQREEQLSTGMTDGVAIPHGRTDAVERMVCAVGVKREGLDFGSADGRPTRIFVLVLTTTAGAEPYLQFVASIMAALTDDGRRRVLAARTGPELYQALTAR